MKRESSAVRVFARRACAAVLPLAILTNCAAACGDSSPERSASAANGGAPASTGAGGGSSAAPGELADVLHGFQAAFPAELTDVAVLGASLKTPGAAFAFVRDRIAFEPYAGVMKGARGTLLTRGGNAIDRALLLAELLKTQGTKASIATGDLSVTQAAALIDQLSRRPSAVEQVAASVPAALKERRAAADARRQLVQGPESRAAAAARDADASLQALGAVLDKGGRRPAARIDAVSRVRTHYWVKAQLPSGLTDLDPTLSNAAEGSRLVDHKQIFDPANMPAAAQQWLAMRVVGEFVESGTLKTLELARAEVAVRDIAGEAVRLVIAPTRLAREQNEFGVSLTLGNAKPVGQTFLITATAGAKESIADAFGGGDGGVSTLGRLTLEATSRVPGAADVTYRRVIVDRLEPSGTAIRPDMRDDDSVRSLLIQAWDGVIDVGAMHPAHLVAVRARAAEAQQPMLRLARDTSAPFGVNDLAPPTLSPLVAGFLYFSGLARAQVLEMYGKGSRAYLARPRVAFLRNGLAVHDWEQAGVSRRFQRSIDLLNAPFGITGAATKHQELAMRIGMADASLERSFAPVDGDFSTIALMQSAAAGHVPMRLVTPSETSVLAALDLPSEMIGVLRGELRLGRTLVAPAGLVGLNGIHTYGWWGIDGESGVPLGQMELGAGQGAVESANLARKVMELSQLIITFYGNLLGCYYMEAAGQLGDTTGAASPFSALLLAPKPSGGRSLAQCILTNACEAIVGYTMMAATSYSIAPRALAAAEELIEMVVQMLIAEHATVMGCAGIAGT